MCVWCSGGGFIHPYASITYYILSIHPYTQAYHIPLRSVSAVVDKDRCDMDIHIGVGLLVFTNTDTFDIQLQSLTNLDSRAQERQEMISVREKHFIYIVVYKNVPPSDTSAYISRHPCRQHRSILVPHIHPYIRTSAHHANVNRTPLNPLLCIRVHVGMRI